MRASPDQIFQEHGMSAFAKTDTHPANETDKGDGRTWPDPDLSLVASGRITPPEFPRDVFGEWADWIDRAAEVKNAPPDYVALGLLATAGSLLGNNRWAAPWSGWAEPPVIWGAIIGDPSASKSPALDAVFTPLNELERALSHEYQADYEAYEKGAEIADLKRAQWQDEARKALKNGNEPSEKPTAANPGEPPVRPRLRVSDVTTEKLAAIIRDQWRGLLLYRDELSGWIGNLDKYGGGGDRPFWLEAYGGRSYWVERQKHPVPVNVDHLTVGVVGGIQPDRLASLLFHGDDDGMLARFAVVWPEPAPLRRPTVSADDETPRHAFERLLSLRPVVIEEDEPRPFYVHFDPDAQDLLQQFRQQCRMWETASDGLMKSHIGKFPGLAIRLATILLYLDWAIGHDSTQPDQVTANHLGRACHYVGEYLRPMAIRTYGDAAAPKEERAAIKLAKMIQQERFSDFTSRDIQRRKISGLRKKQEIEPALNILSQASWVRCETVKTGGHPRQVFQVNPAIFQGT